MKNKLIKGLLAAMLASTACADAALSNGKTFIAHRDALANAGMEWVNGSHPSCKAEKDCEIECKAKDQEYVKAGRRDRVAKKKNCNKLGACITATPFYTQTSNSADLAYLFGMGTTGAITVTAGVPTASTVGSALYNTNVIQSPNSDGSSLAKSAGLLEDGSTADTASNRVPAYGTVALSPIRQEYGAHLGWHQSLDALFKGLSFSVRAPIVQVRSSMRANTTNTYATSIPAEDGPSGSTLKDYFNGAVSVARTGSNLHVIQAALSKNLINNTYATATGLADLEIAMNYGFKFAKMNALSFGIGAAVQIPTSNKPTMTRLFEPLYGARGHVGAGAQGFVHADLYNKKGVCIGFDLSVNWKYFFKATEMRTMGIYDLTNLVVLPASSYRLVMQNGVTGVQPAANVLTVNHDVTPRNQVDAVAGFCAKYKNFSANLGYNFYWHQQDVVTMKSGAWTNDKFALAHPHYSMNTAVPATVGDTTHYVVGGTSYVSGTTVNHNGGFIGDDSGGLSPDDYADDFSQATKHGYVIGSNGDAGGTPYILPSTALAGNGLSDNVYPGAFTSLNGPIQAAGSSSSNLVQQLADSTNASSLKGGNVAQAAKLAVRYNTTSTPGVTSNQMTHSVVGGVSYKFNGNFPMVVGIGGQGEFQASSRNSALEGYKVWAKVGISF